MRLTKQTIGVRNETSSKQTTGYVCKAIPGLAIARGFCNDKGWSLTHIGTGLRCCDKVDRRTAIIALERLIAAGIDWTLDHDSLLNVYGRLYLRDTIANAIEVARFGRPRQKFLFAI